MRKGILCLFLAAGPAVSVIAQKGSILLTSTISAFSERRQSESGDNKTTAVSLRVGTGYAIADRWTLGINAGYNRYEDANLQKQFSLGPFVRYTHPLSTLLSFFGQLDADYCTQKNTGNPQQQELRLSLQPAVELALARQFALNFSVGSLNYQTSRVDGKDERYHRFGFNLGSGASFGLTKRFGGAK
ncbi:outer membrane beta-barrel protein [Paraflavisolibacter sp. H34]|uniref:outer membrane beta-barrel protein n=1 Tax=Huijunlia imazamoxiresistens TaxID=3127457 RepID=UPI003018849A